MSARFSPDGTPRARVLVVDDEQEIRGSVGRVLQLLGYEVNTAMSGERALEMIAAYPYDVALLDIRLPGIDGVEVMHAAAALRPDLAVILLTGYATLDSAVAALRAGAADYLRKPASVRDIAAAVSRALMKRRQEDPDESDDGAGMLEAGPLMLISSEQTVIVSGGPADPVRRVYLTKSETVLLSCLIERAGLVVSSRDLARSLGYQLRDGDARALIRPHISRLRRKVEPNPESPCIIITAPGQGYSLATDALEAAP